MVSDRLDRAADAILAAGSFVAFTGAGISVESGIPPFRGESGIWSKYDPRILELGHFSRHPDECWVVIKEIFYDYFGKAEPNDAHRFLAELEQRGLLDTLITQNIDALHFQAGSRNVIEYHGNSRLLVCTACAARKEADPELFRRLPPTCECGGILKPDFVFFGEGIPPRAARDAEQAAGRAECMLLIGTTGEVFPAAYLPRQAKAGGAVIIEVNPQPSAYTAEITDIYLPMSATTAARELRQRLTAALGPIG